MEGVLLLRLGYLQVDMLVSVLKKFIGRDFYLDSLWGAFLIRPFSLGENYSFSLKQKKRPENNKFYQVKTFAAPPPTLSSQKHVSEYWEQRKKQQISTDSWSYFKIASCMKHEKENLYFPAPHLFFLLPREWKSWINISNNTGAKEWKIE